VGEAGGDHLLAPVEEGDQRGAVAALQLADEEAALCVLRLQRQFEEVAVVPEVDDSEVFHKLIPFLCGFSPPLVWQGCGILP
jgi:hypothetical protein